MIEGMRVLGLEQARRNLQTLSDKLQNQIVRASLRQAGNVYLRAIRAATYGAGRVRRTGLLERAQSVSTSKRGDVLSAKVRMRNVNTAARGQDRNLMAPFYWWFLEKGTKARRTVRGGNRGSISARPWVVPTFHANTDRALEEFKSQLTRRLDEATTQLPQGGQKP